MALIIKKEDITKMTSEAIVNAANTELKMGGGVCGAIFKAAGPKILQEACDKLAPIITSQPVITPAFDLPAKYIIHVAGPVYDENNKDEAERLLYNSYQNALELAVDKDIKSISFPLISSGIYGYPKKEALEVAKSSINDFLAKVDLDVYLLVFDKEAFKLDGGLLEEIDGVLEKYYDEDKGRTVYYSRPLLEEKEVISYEISEESLDAALDRQDESFSELLFKIIDKKDLEDTEVYKGANIDRRLFSKMRNKDYQPSKKTALALAVSLKLDIDETDEFL